MYDLKMHGWNFIGEWHLLRKHLCNSNLHFKCLTVFASANLFLQMSRITVIYIQQSFIRKIYNCQSLAYLRFFPYIFPMLMVYRLHIQNTVKLRRMFEPVVNYTFMRYFLFNNKSTLEENGTCSRYQTLPFFFACNVPRTELFETSKLLTGSAYVGYRQN